ncbi:MAG: CRTAC1 family protein [Planctomyces sp.]|nr:CRTAC1 family protein [Planctomyces sp.]
MKRIFVYPIACWQFLVLAMVGISGCQPDSGSPDNAGIDAGGNQTVKTSNSDNLQTGQNGGTVGGGGFTFKPSEREAEFVKNGDGSSHTVRPILLNDVAEQLGIRHIYDNGASPRALMVESTGGGVGWLDIERDGVPDLYCVQGGVPDAADVSIRPRDTLYRQRAGMFSAVQAGAVPEEHSFGQGVSVADFNNDGFDDIFVTNVGLNSLLINQGDGTFIADEGGVVCGLSVWSSTSAWGDVDKDGDLDLYVCNYAIYDPYHPVPCNDEHGMPTICHPRHVEPEPDQFYLNQGDGSFVEVSQKFGLFGPGNKALGVVIADFTRDGWPDIYVANDTTANFFFVNNGRGDGFLEQAFALGGAFNALGETQASMGVAFGDYDANGYQDICLTHFTGESNTLYQNLGARGFQDVSALTGIRDLTLPKLGFGAVMCDLNADRCMDMFITNGHIDPRNSDGDGYEMCAQLTSYNGARWVDQGSAAGPFFSRRLVGRGVATSDFDTDGDVDVMVAHQNTAAALLRNESECGAWLQIRPLAVRSNRFGIGTVVTLKWGENVLTQELAGGTSYASAQQPVMFFGLGDCTSSVEISVEWPSGQKDHKQVDSGTLNRILTIVEHGDVWIHEAGTLTRQDVQ